MNYELFIAKRIIGSKSYKSSISAPIIKIGIIAIATGMIVMLISIATGLGLQHKIRDKIVAFNGHINIENYDSDTSYETQVPIRNDTLQNGRFDKLEGISHVQGVASRFGIIRTRTDFEGVFVKGVSTDYNWKYLEEFLVEGSLPDYTSKLNRDVLISRYTANRLGFKVGDSFQMLFAKQTDTNPRIRKFIIVGIFDSGFQELDEKFMIADLRHIQLINKWESNQVGNFEVFIDDIDQINFKGVEVYQNIPSTLNATTIKESYVEIFEWLSVFDNNTYGIIFIMILVAGINMITALLVLILERTQMIGILKSIGSHNQSIQKIFLYNASYLIGLGLFWGNLIGLSLLFAQDYFGFLKFPDPEQYYVSKIPVYISWDYILLLNLGTFVASILLLIIPSFIISRISPVKAIRFS